MCLIPFIHGAEVNEVLLPVTPQATFQNLRDEEQKFGQEATLIGPLKGCENQANGIHIQASTLSASRHVSAYSYECAFKRKIIR
jgi:hypothetical protein